MTDAPHQFHMTAGQRITCDNGHTIAVADRDIRPGYGDWMGRMSWIQPAPASGGSTSCTLCGAQFMLRHYGAPHDPVRWLPDSPPIYTRMESTWLCIDGAWVPPLTPEARAYLDTGKQP